MSEKSKKKTDAALGLEDGSVRLVPYESDWPRLFREEAARIQAALGRRILGVEHVGSTAVPGLVSKPILDMLGGVPRLEDARDCIEPLAEIGYEDLGIELVPGHHVFGRGDPRTHHLHLVERDGDRWRILLRFRDALRADPDLVARYEDLKRRLAGEFPYRRADYTEAKGDFIRSVLARDD